MASIIASWLYGSVVGENGTVNPPYKVAASTAPIVPNKNVGAATIQFRHARLRLETMSEPGPRLPMDTSEAAAGTYDEGVGIEGGGGVEVGMAAAVAVPRSKS